MHSRYAKDHLQEEWHLLARKWASVGEGWRDENYYRFEREFWSSYEKQMPTWLRDLEEVCEMVQQVDRELKTSGM